MKTQINYWVLGAMAAIICLAGCGSDDDEQPQEMKTTYTMGPVSDPGISGTTVTQLDNGTAITYEGLLAFNGHANVHLSSAMMSTLIAQGNIGSNHSGGSGNGDGNGGGDGGY